MIDPYYKLQAMFEYRDLLPAGIFFELPLKNIGREDSYATALQYLYLAKKNTDNISTIVELGTTRGPIGGGGGPAADGWATLAWGWYAKNVGAKVYTIDIDSEALDYSRVITAEYADYIDYVESDSIAFLNAFTKPIDLLFLDSGNDHDLMLNEFKAAEPNLHGKSLVLLDDCSFSYVPGSNYEIALDEKHDRPVILGPKAEKLVPHLRDLGWQEIYYKNSQMLFISKKFLEEVLDYDSNSNITR